MSEAGSKAGAGSKLQYLMNNVEARAQGLTTEKLEPNATDISFSFNLKVLDKTVHEAVDSKKTISLWSPRVSALLWYLKETNPSFSISREAGDLLDAALQKKYPELYDKIKQDIISLKIERISSAER